MKKYQYKVQGVDYEVEITEVEGKIARVNVNGIPFEIEMQKPINAAKHPALAAARLQASGVTPSAAVSQKAPSAAPAAAPATTAAAAPAAVGAGNVIKAPLPGTITEIKVQVGQTVAVGDTVVVLEAMKMHNNIESEYAGQVTSVVVKQGETVMEGAVLLTIG